MCAFGCLFKFFPYKYAPRYTYHSSPLAKSIRYGGPCLCRSDQAHAHAYIPHQTTEHAYGIGAHIAQLELIAVGGCRAFDGKIHKIRVPYKV